MRKWNNRLATIIIVLFLLHALMGSLLLLGLSTISFQPLSWLLLAAVIAHGLLGMIGTLPAVMSGIKTGHWYLRENAVFWTKRISGISIRSADMRRRE